MKFGDTYIGQPVYNEKIDQLGYIKELEWIATSRPDKGRVVVDFFGNGQIGVWNLEDMLPAKGLY